MKKLLVLSLTILSFTGCEKNFIDGRPSIIGKWSWISTCGGIAYQCSTPETSNLNFKIVITADSIYNYYQNGTLIESTRFHTYELTGFEPSNNPPYATYVIKWDSGRQGMFSINNEVLSMWDGNPDGYSSQYERIK